MDATAKTNGATSATRFEALAKVPPIAHPLAEEPSEIASNISYHVQYSPHFSLFKFDPEQAYYATADSVRDRLIKVGLLIFFGIFMPLIVCFMECASSFVVVIFLALLYYEIGSAHTNVRK